MYEIMQEDPRESLMTVRTRAGMLKGWYFPAIALGDTSAMRFHPTPYGDPQYAHFATEALAVAWITGN